MKILLHLFFLCPYLLLAQEINTSSNLDITKSWSQEPNGWTYSIEIYMPNEAMPQGGWISLSATQKESNIEIRVTDNGEGIPEESWNKVFDPLYTNKKDGIGLGLSICRELTERHNGSITIETSSQIGTTFLILLPAPSLILA